MPGGGPEQGVGWGSYEGGSSDVIRLLGVQRNHPVRHCRVRHRRVPDARRGRPVPEPAAPVALRRHRRRTDGHRGVPRGAAHGDLRPDGPLLRAPARTEPPAALDRRLGAAARGHGRLGLRRRTGPGRGTDRQDPRRERLRGRGERGVRVPVQQLRLLLQQGRPDDRRGGPPAAAGRGGQLRHHRHGGEEIRRPAGDRPPGIGAAQWPGVSVHVVPFGTGPHHLRSPLELVYLRDGSSLAYTQGSWSGHLANDPEEVEPLRIAFDALRDSALVPAESLTFLRTLLEEHAGEEAQA
ncbi:Scr1 family TA system antitoxin-like transcriptional regulator [Actinacidiphila sp. bgisy145]|uniref:Scr1 family TA system antitoxin-like transcriptional regulator n=1 Tax=Actinacidiphila sp. bgisy145 TaxID=3413792 RepID=UPI003EC11010